MLGTSAPAVDFQGFPIWGQAHPTRVFFFRPLGGTPKPTCLDAFMVNNLVFRWPKPRFFMVLVAHGP